MQRSRQLFRALGLLTRRVGITSITSNAQQAGERGLVPSAGRRYILSNAFRNEAGLDIPRDASKQAFETGGVECTEASFGEYMKALVKLDALDNNRMFSTLQ
eukprot:gene2399-2703_t